MGTGGRPRFAVLNSTLEPGRVLTDDWGMKLNAIALLLVAGIGLVLYIMRRRSRMGKRTPKF